MPLVNTDVYPTKRNITTEVYSASYSLADLYNRFDYNGDTVASTLPVPGEGTMDTSNVYGWMDENCVYMRRSNTAVDLTTGVMTQVPMDTGAANLRMMYHTTVDWTVTPLVYKDIAPNLFSETEGNELFYEPSQTPGTYLGLAFNWVPITRIQYADLIYYVRFMVTSIDHSSDGIGRWAVDRSDLEQGYIGGTQVMTTDEATELFQNGFVKLSNNNVVAISGITITPLFGQIEEEGTENVRSAHFSFFPTVETNVNGNPWFGSVCASGEASDIGVSVNGLTYYNQQWIGGNSIYGQDYTTGSPELMSLSIANWSKDYTFGSTNDFTVDMLNFEPGEDFFINEGNFIFKKYRSVSGATNVVTCFTYEECMNMAASFGVYFTFNRDAAAHSLLGPNLNPNGYGRDVYLGKMYPDGRCDGTYTQSSATFTEPQAQEGMFIVTTEEEDTTMDVEPIDPSQPYVPGGDDDDDPDSDFPKGHDPVGTEPSPDFNFSDMVSGSEYVALNSQQMNTLKNQLKAAIQSNPSFWSSIAPKLSVPSTNPIFSGQEVDTEFIISDASSNISNYILSCRMYPFDVTDKLFGSYSQSSALEFGFKGATLPVNNWELDGLAAVVPCGSVNVPFFKERLTYFDLEPYTKCRIILPCIGTYEIPSQDVVGHTITVRYGVDLTTGISTAVVTASDSVGDRTLLTKSGKMGIDVSLSGNDLTAQADNIAIANNQRAQTYLSGGTKILSGAVSGVSGALTGNPVGVAMGAVNGAAQIANGALDMQLADINNTIASRDVPKNITAGTGFSSRIGILTPYIVVQRPVVDEPSGYGRTFGFMWNRKARLGDLSGFTVCANPKMDIPGATEDELALINSLLRQGVYIR